jgi:glutamate formiminotransferase
VIAVPNFSVGADSEAIAALEGALAGHARVLDVHSDAIHDRSVFNLAGEAEELVAALRAGAELACERIDMRKYRGAHPAVGALDVAPAVWLTQAERETAAATAKSAAQELADLGIPVFFYGELARSDERRERAFFRRGGRAELRRRMRSGELEPDVGPGAPHPRAGATLVSARPPLAAFNLVLEGVNETAAAGIAARSREAGGGPAGLRAIAIDLGGGRFQISTNVHDPLRLTLGEVVGLVASLAREAGGRVVEAEVVGLVPKGALEGFPREVPIAGFDPARQLIERRLAS